MLTAIKNIFLFIANIIYFVLAIISGVIAYSVISLALFFDWITERKKHNDSNRN